MKKYTDSVDSVVNDRRSLHEDIAYLIVLVSD